VDSSPPASRGAAHLSKGGAVSVYVVGVVPARLESSRFPRKVLREVAGKPLVVHAFERLSAASLVDETMIATDSDQVRREAERFGAPAVLVEEPCRTGSDRVARAIQGRAGDVVVNLQADQPLIEPGEIDRVLRALMDDETLDISTLAFHDEDDEAFRSRDSVKVVTDESGGALYFSRAPIPSGKEATGNSLFLHHVGIYCFRRAALERFAALKRGRLEARESLEQLRALEAGMRIGVLVSEKALPDVDRPEDIAAVERALGGK